MKKLKAIQILGVIALAIFMPLMLQGCMGGGKEKLTLSQQFRTYYYVGEAIDLDGGMVKYTNEDGDELQLDVTIDMISGFSTTTEGTRVLYITYNEKQVAVNYTVYDLKVQDDVWYVCEKDNGFFPPENWTTMCFNKENDSYNYNSYAEGYVGTLPDKNNSQYWNNYTMEATKNGLVLIVSETYTDPYVGTSTMYMKFYNITENSFMLDISGTNLDGNGTNMELTTFNFTKFVG